MLWAHQRGELPIGKAVKVTKTRNGEMRIKVKFAEPDEYSFADTIYKLIKGGYLNAVSIGFIPDFNEISTDEKTGARIFNKSELLELSVVPVPANQGALRLGKAVSDGIIDEVELKEYELYCKELEDDFIEDENDEDDKISKVFDKLDKLEQEIKELKEKSYLENLFSKDTSPEGKEGQTDEEEFTDEDRQEIYDFFNSEENNEE